VSVLIFLHYNERRLDRHWATETARRSGSLTLHSSASGYRPEAYLLGLGNRAVENLLRLEDVSFSYEPAAAEPHWALAGVSLEVARGAYLAVLGHNGSGKSTLARCLNALLIPTKGQVWVGAWDTREAGHWREIRSTVGMVFQVPDNQIIATTVEDDVAFGPENLGVPDAELAGRVREALAAVGLWNERGREPHQLSAGQKQRLAIAGVIAMRPACLVLDEATSLLDPQGRADVLGAVRRLHAAGTTVITITHRMAEVAEAQRVVVLERGRIALQGTPRQVFTQTETLNALGLDAPPAAELSAALHRRYPDFPADRITVPELVEALVAQHGGAA
jgi:energy-coupling factor transporter ATPase